MRQGLYMVFDSKVVGYSMPFMSPSDAAASRTFGDACRREGTLMFEHPEDFVLMRVADIDDATGAVAVPVTPVEICQGRHVVKKESANVR